MSAAAPDNHRRADLARYSLMALPLAFVGLPVYLHAPDFYARSHGADLAAIGAALLALRLVDAFQDPLIGMASDKAHHRRRLVLVAGMVVMACGFLMVFNPPGRHLIAWFAVSVLLCTTGYSIVSINFLALGGLWRSGPSGRTQVTGWREATGLVGLLLASLLPTLLGLSEDPDRAFNRLSLLFLPILAVCAWVFFAWMAKAALSEPAPGAGRMGQALADAAKSGWNRGFFAIYLLNAFAGSIPAVLVVFFVNDRIGANDLLGFFFLAYFLCGALSMPAWRLVSERIGKERAWMWGMWLAVATFSWAAFLGEGDVAAYGVVCALSGFALGSDLSLPPSILADRIARRRDEDISSSYFSVMTFCTKSAFALATGITLPFLALFGYQPGAMDGQGQSSAVLLSVAYAAVPCVLKAGVALLLYVFLRANGTAGTAGTAGAAGSADAQGAKEMAHEPGQASQEGG